MAVCVTAACGACVHASPSPRVLVVWQVILHNAGGSGEPPKTFTFDQVYDDTSQQEVTHTRTHGHSHRSHHMTAAAQAQAQAQARC